MVSTLQTHELTKSYNGRTVVRGVSLEVHAGEVVGLLGPNGAGKTTTLHMVLGLTTPDAGTVRMFGRDLAKHRTWALSRVNFAASYVSLPWVLRVVELLDVFAHMYGLREPRRQVARMMELLDLGDLRDRRYGQLSSGQQTRVQLAKALLNEPGLLVLDEPTANLDPDVGDRIRELLLREAHRTGRAMLITSHNMPEVERMCSRIHFVSSGQIVATGSAVELAGAYGVDDLEAVFLRVARG